MGQVLHHGTSAASRDGDAAAANGGVMIAREDLTPDEIEIERQTMLIEEQDRWWAASPKDAVEYLETKIWRCDLKALRHYHDTGRPFDQTDDTVTLSLDAARLLLDCARKGMHKGQGRRRPSLSRWDRKIRDGWFAWARRRKAKLIDTRDSSILDDHGRPSAAKAEEKAAEETRQFAHDRNGLNLATNTILWPCVVVKFSRDL
jgi:hypothetical protein